MSFPDRFSFHFFPVGQGLFSSGSILRHGEGTARFLWVYDCGTASSRSLVTSGLRRLLKFAGTRRRIDLLVLSHFDHDHVSGVVSLLKEFKIGTLVLPYMPLAQRLIIGFEEGSGGTDDPLTDFYLNPVAFLLAQEGPGIERILFVPPSGNEGPDYPGELPTPREPGPENEPRIDFDSRMPENADDLGTRMRAGQQTAEKAAIAFLRPGSRITLGSCLWEFIPYNDDPVEPIAPEFESKVAEQHEALLSATSSAHRDKALKELKDAYDEHFGAGSVERNMISLFLYSGPIYSSWKACWLTEGQSMSWPEIGHWHHWPFPDLHAWTLEGLPREPLRSRCSILYSGDGYLDTNERLQRLIRYLDERRVRRIGVFQVMHHGAEANWHPGVARAIDPLFSVFCSDPERKRWKHPHAPVLRDFWRCGAVQVDKNGDFNASGYMSG